MGCWLIDKEMLSSAYGLSGVSLSLKLFAGDQISLVVAHYAYFFEPGQVHVRREGLCGRQSQKRRQKVAEGSPGFDPGPA